LPEIRRSDSRGRKISGVLEKIDSEENAEIADTLNEIGWVYHDKGDYKKAEQFYSRALEIYERSSG